MSFKAGEEYRFSVWARVPDGGSSKIRVELVDTKAMGETQTMTQQEITIDSKEWKKYTVILKPETSVTKGKLRIFLSKPEHTVDLEHISLFRLTLGTDMRTECAKDLAQALADLKPGIFRFPADVSLRVPTSTPVTTGRRL